MVRTIFFVIGGAVLCYFAGSLIGGFVHPDAGVVLGVGGLFGGGYYGWRQSRKGGVEPSAG